MPMQLAFVCKKALALFLNSPALQRSSMVHCLQSPETLARWGALERRWFFSTRGVVESSNGAPSGVLEKKGGSVLSVALLNHLRVGKKSPSVIKFFTFECSKFCVLSSHFLEELSIVRDRCYAKL